VSTRWPSTGLRRALLGCTIATMALTACGSSDADKIETAMGDLRTAYLAEDYQAVCDLLTPTARRDLGKLGHGEPTRCPRDMAEKMSATILSRRDRIDPKIVTIEVAGETATVMTKLGSHTPTRVRFAKHRGDWKLNRLYDTSAPAPPDFK
jgi:hypothetical protein